MSGKPFRPAELQAIIKSATVNGYDRRSICAELDIPLYRLNNAIATKIYDEWHEGQKAFKAAQGAESKPSRRFADILAVPVPTYAEAIPLKKKKGGRQKTAVVYTDTHFPYHDDKALDVVRGIIKDTKPHLIVHLGDLLDCYEISKFDHDPAKKLSLQDEIDLARVHLHQISQLAPDAEKLLLGGNHEDRLRKIIWNLQGASRELAKLRVFQKTMVWPVLLDLAPIGWEWADYSGVAQPVAGRIPKLLLKHGDAVRKWAGATGLAEWQKHGRSGMSGHVHRMGAFTHRDMNGSQGWWEIGATCSMSPEYVRQPDWNQSCAVVTYTENWFHVENIYIENGKALGREKEFAA